MSFTPKFSRSYTPIKTIIEEATSLLETTVIIAGFIKSVRQQFLRLTDGSYIRGIQLVFPDELSGLLTDLKTGGSIKATGIVKTPPDSSKERVEIHVTSVEHIGKVYDPITYPFAKKGHTLAHIRDYPHLRQRLDFQQAITRIAHELDMAIHQYYDSIGLIHYRTPCLTSSDCEGAGEVLCATTLVKTDSKDIPTVKDSSLIDFTKDLFGKAVYLTVSGQLHGETATCSGSGVGGIYTFGPTFRAEGSQTSRHLAEFWMIEPELRFVELDDVISLAEDTIKSALARVLDKCSSELDFLDSFHKLISKETGLSTDRMKLKEKLERIVSADFHRVRYSTAWEQLKAVESEAHFSVPITPFMDFQVEHEKYLVDVIYGGYTVVVTHYPKEIKAFYMKEDATDPTYVQSFDVLVPGVGELVGGSIREDSYEKLMERITERKMDPTPLEYYLDLRKMGTVPHGGFGIGFERLIMWVTEMPSIRDVIPFPRYGGRCDC